MTAFQGLRNLKTASRWMDSKFDIPSLGPEEQRDLKREESVCDYESYLIILEFDLSNTVFQFFHALLLTNFSKISNP